MMRPLLKYLIILLFVVCVATVNAQNEKEVLKQHIATLCSPRMDGRGYVGKGKEYAAQYIESRFREYGLKPAVGDSNYTQPYYFGVNTFPDNMSLIINGEELKPGVDYLIDAASPSYGVEDKKIKRIRLDRITDTLTWQKKRSSFTNDRIYFLEGFTMLSKRLSIRQHDLAASFPKGCYIVPQHGKLTWTVSTETIPATVFYVEDTVLPHRIRKADVNVRSVYQHAARNVNVIGIVPGTVKDTFIVFTAHYDHLGMMGKRAMFKGASDNASGTAMLLYLANYYVQHPQRYSMAFIAFSGEEAGLLGSANFVKHPQIPLGNIRFLTNLDIMGDATEGITVVNATEYPEQFARLEAINTRGDYLPYVKSRGKAANSDHYHFSEAGVPAFFIYTNGGKGYYHDVFDIPKELSLNNVDRLSKLLIDFANALAQ